MTNLSEVKPSFDKRAAVQQAQTLFDEKKYAEAIPIYRKILEWDLNDGLVWAYLGISLRSLGYYDSAVVCLKRALELNQNSPVMLSHYAACLMYLKRKVESLHTFDIALRLSPKDFSTICYYAFALRELDMCEEALIYYNIALTIEPENADVIWQRAQTYLHLGRYKEGWQDFEIRWILGKQYPFWILSAQEKKFRSRRWTGEDLNNKTIFVYSEQGLGDSILFSRYIPMVKARGGKVIFKTAPELYRFFHTMPSIDGLVEDIDIKDKIDYHVPLMSLPGLFGTELDTIPSVPTYYVPKEPPAEATKLLNFAQGLFKVGIIWSGRSNFVGNYKRSVSFKHFLSLAEIAGVQLYSLQKGSAEQGLADCGAQGLVLELGPHMKDLADTAAVLKNLDLVIMTDSSVAHLAGWIGCPIWNLLSTGAYWVYLTDRENSPWYPSMRLFRQKEPGDWDSVFKRIVAELLLAVEQKKSSKWPWPLITKC